jgi:hypothetical protein
MRFKKELSFPFLTLTQDDLKLIAQHVRGLSDQARAEAEAEVRKSTPRGTDPPEVYEGRIRERLEFYLFRGGFSLTTRDGSLSDESWDDLWLKASYPDLRVISMVGKSRATEVSIRFSLTGPSGYGHDVTVESDSEVEFQREIGYFSELFARLEAPTRRRFSPASMFGKLLWLVALPVVLMLLVLRVVALGLRLSGTASAAGGVRGVSDAGLVVIIASTYLFVAFGFVIWASGIAQRLVPRVVIKGVGPDQGLRDRAGVLVLGFIGSAVFAIASWLVGPV